MLVENTVSWQATVAQEVTRLFVSESLDSFFPCQPIATLNRICKALELLAQTHAAMVTQVGSRDHDVAGPLNRKSVRPVILQGQRHLFATAVKQVRPDRFDGTEPHARRSSGGKDAEDKLLPKLLIRSAAPQLFKLVKPRANLFLSRPVCGTYVFNNYRLTVRSHLDCQY